MARKTEQKKNNTGETGQEKVDATYQKLKQEAEERGYYLNPDVEFTKALIAGLLTNSQRYGYWACPCRLASGIRQEDLDIICPCDYRDIDINQFNTCFCGLYVSYDAAHGNKTISSITDRRPNAEERKKMREKRASEKLAVLQSSALGTTKPKVSLVPENSGFLKKEEAAKLKPSQPSQASPKLPVWRCTVCGYLCAREEAPDICPICKVTKDRFERFM